MRYIFVNVLSMGLLLFATGPLRSETIKLSYNSEWAPYSLGLGPSVGGVLPELLREIIEKRMGISVYQNGGPLEACATLCSARFHGRVCDSPDGEKAATHPPLEKRRLHP